MQTCKLLSCSATGLSVTDGGGGGRVTRKMIFFLKMRPKQNMRPGSTLDH